ncbi:MAG: heparan-alpha-glucosaminide N-acetyltransferase domain-containing protein, partial [Microcella sp.]|nr:heparan-alpha-glucosaminide N-acetyltransferase domain-containing protein [Microcella sp.]
MTAPTLSALRFSGVDAARGLAVIGMIAAHVWPRTDQQGELLVDGRPSMLFAVVAGIALGIVSGHAETAGVPRADARWRLLIRAGLLIALGLLLWMLPSGIAIILDYYGLMFVLLLPLLFVPRIALAAVAALLLVVAPLARDQLVATGSPVEQPWVAASDYLLTGYYPALIWLPLLIAGLLCARSDLSSTRTRLLMVTLGTLASVAGYGAAAVLPNATAEAHSSTVPELLGSGGLAVALVGLALLALDSSATPRVLLIAASPIVAVGRMPLTIYTAHVLVIAAFSPLGPAGQFDAAVGIPLFIGLTVASAVFA